MNFIILLTFIFSSILLSVNSAPNQDPGSEVFGGKGWFRHQVVRCSADTCTNSQHGTQCCEGPTEVKCVYSIKYCPHGYAAVSFDGSVNTDAISPWNFSPPQWSVSLLIRIKNLEERQKKLDRKEIDRIDEVEGKIKKLYELLNLHKSK